VVEVRELRAQEVGGNLLVEGSGQLVRALSVHGLVDELRLTVCPVILGSGARLYPEAMPAPATLEVTSSVTVGSGVTLLVCSPALAASARTAGPGGAPAACAPSEQGGVVITDGPFVEGKEHIGAVWVIEADDLDAELAWAAKATPTCSVAAGGATEQSAPTARPWPARPIKPRPPI
jgi:hypothetical protein